MSQVYRRTENGRTTAFVDQAEGLAEINEAMMGGRRQVRTMSSITRTDYAIEHKDGRNVLLTLVDAPAPEGFTQGQAVVVKRPGRDPQTGTVAHIHTAPGYVAVRDDRFGSVSSYPTRFVSAVETEKQPAEELESPARPNLQTHTGVVHASGARTKALPVGRAPKCCASRSALARYHFLIPTEQAVTCRRCLAALAKESSRN
ncbi:hypothetical protein [Streptomyces sp. SPB074]|uniref:hypothetical protein n=1 Tax=Streptomyces sp. (strain SPB074) TaxID=465543 RepID=UPI00017F0E7B|nr:hypothetical protein [Streptomyces sp. SPB074]EDY43951.1 conserved hypothetical protein [Streptomyces sp. SPB074]